MSVNTINNILNEKEFDTHKDKMKNMINRARTVLKNPKHFSVIQCLGI